MSADRSTPAIELDAVEFRYEDMLMRFSLSVPSGAFLAVIGPSGSGKSTLLNLIAGFERPVSGHVRLFGIAMGGTPPAERPVTMLFQDNNLFAHLDVAANVGLGIDPGLRLSASDRERVTAALTEVGLSGFETRRPAQMSGGERQRVALARCLVRNRPILLLDEPFAALGPRMRHDMLELVDRLRQTHGLTVVMVTHSPPDARRGADLTAFVLAGEVRLFGPTAKLLARRDDAALVDYLGDAGES
jgi:thiamine transport system ATP-binding protein